jgi:hypothetical protein
VMPSKFGSSTGAKDPVTLSAVRREAERRTARNDTARGVTISTSSLQLRQISGLQRS